MLILSVFIFRNWQEDSNILIKLTGSRKVWQRLRISSRWRTCYPTKVRWTKKPIGLSSTKVYLGNQSQITIMASKEKSRYKSHYIGFAAWTIKESHDAKGARETFDATIKSTVTLYETVDVSSRNKSMRCI